MPLTPHKTKIVATIGPASDSPAMLEKLIRAGMTIARLNFSHGDFTIHAEYIRRLRDAERAVGRRIAILADLPGPKMRVGSIDPEPVELRAGDVFTLTPEEIVGNAERVSVTYERLPKVVRPGDRLFLNDGQIQLQVAKVVGLEIRCRILVGGELRSRKGLNLPGIDLGLSAFTEHDHACLDFALRHGVDAVSQSFVETAADITAVRAAAAALNRNPFLIAKIERAGALKHIDEILRAADGIMVARGDLGVEVPIERIALTQKELVAKANSANKPVITATQMLESMVSSRIPTRAEATDVANAILDGTDAVMLSAESAMGRFPEEAVTMLARIATVTEAQRPTRPSLPSPTSPPAAPHPGGMSEEAFVPLVEHALNAIECAAVFIPTKTGTTARLVSRFKPRVWIAGMSADPQVCASLLFSYGVSPIQTEEEPYDWREFTTRWSIENNMSGAFALLVTGPSLRHPYAHHRIEFVPLGARPNKT